MKYECCDWDSWRKREKRNEMSQGDQLIHMCMRNRNAYSVVSFKGNRMENMYLSVFLFTLPLFGCLCRVVRYSSLHSICFRHTLIQSHARVRISKAQAIIVLFESQSGARSSGKKTMNFIERIGAEIFLWGKVEKLSLEIIKFGQGGDDSSTESNLSWISKLWILYFHSINNWFWDTNTPLHKMKTIYELFGSFVRYELTNTSWW